MKWIVAWVIVNSFLVSCPKPAPICNEFGICNDNIQFNTVACFETEEKQMSQTFCSKDEALAFIERSKQHNCQSVSIGLSSCIKNIQITKIITEQATALDLSDKAPPSK